MREVSFSEKKHLQRTPDAENKKNYRELNGSFKPYLQGNKILPQGPPFSGNPA